MLMQTQANKRKEKTRHTVQIRVHPEYRRSISKRHQLRLIMHSNFCYKMLLTESYLFFSEYLDPPFACLPAPLFLLVLRAFGRIFARSCTVNFKSCTFIYSYPHTYQCLNIIAFVIFLGS